MVLAASDQQQTLDKKSGRRRRNKDADTTYKGGKDEVEYVILDVNSTKMMPITKVHMIIMTKTKVIMTTISIGFNLDSMSS